ncbi:MAG TPA: hypothetical protein VFE60_05340 [Roseiarcus sp.]|jgi:hypothetical protein|nr:hypothetical protein [Roseiarcus sp.]
MTPEQFAARMYATADDIGLGMSHTPRERQEAWLEGFGHRTHVRWIELFPGLTAEDVSGMVADFVGRIRAARDSLERLEAGRA